MVRQTDPYRVYPVNKIKFSEIIASMMLNKISISLSPNQVL